MRLCKYLCVCLREACAYQHLRHICNSQQPPSHIVPISAYLQCFFSPSSVHCFGLQLLYLFRLTGGLALPLGFKMGNGLAEKRVDNRDRQGPDHQCYQPPPPPTQILLLSVHHPPKQIGHVNFLSSLSLLSHAISCLSFASIPCHSALTFFLPFFFISFHTPWFSPSASPHFSPLRFSREEECQWLGGVRKNGRAVPINCSVLSTPALVEWNQIKKKEKKESVSACVCVRKKGVRVGGWSIRSVDRLHQWDTWLSCLLL